MQNDSNERPLRAIVAAVQLPNVTDIELHASLTELRELAKTLGHVVVATFIQKRATFDSFAYLGEGKREEIKRYVEGESAGVLSPDDESDIASTSLNPAAKKARTKDTTQSDEDIDSRQADILLIDHNVSPSQARHLEVEVGCEVIDRTMVILEIFHRHASSRAARAQVEIARLGYMAPRLREAAKMAGPQGRQRSGTGGRGAGESHSQLDRQKIRNRIAELELDIIAMDAERQTQRARRTENQGQQGIARVALVGYTNAGKSTLMRALTGSEVLVANKLFATLDTTVRALHPETVPRVLVTDTVGFIKNLPHDLVASFKSTLEEAAESALLLHVIDASDTGFERQRLVTDEVLSEIGAADVPRIRVFNKIDMVGDAVAQAARATALRQAYPDCVVMSARNAENVATLHEMIRKFFQKDQLEVELFLDWSAQQLRGKIFASCEVIEERSDEDGAYFRVRAGEAMLNSLCDEGVVRVAIQAKPAKKKAAKPVLPKVAKVNKK
jgi:GTPase